MDFPVSVVARREGLPFFLSVAARHLKRLTKARCTCVFVPRPSGLRGTVRRGQAQAGRALPCASWPGVS